MTKVSRGLDRGEFGPTSPYDGDGAIPDLSVEAKKHAVGVICGKARGRDDAAELLDAFGLTFAEGRPAKGGAQ